MVCIISGDLRDVKQ
jgi:hypothetical protein